MAKLGYSFVAALDIGTTKIVCFIAQVDTENNIKIVGIGHQVSQGIKSGTITDIKLAESSIRGAVGAAEQMAGVNVERVIVNISDNKQKSHKVSIEMPLQGQEITSKDIIKIIEQGCSNFRSETSEIIHCIPLEYEIDGTKGISNPKGMFGNILGVDLNIVTTSSPSLYNLVNCLGKCHLDIEDYISSPYASGLAVLSEDEMNLGSIVIDFGGGNTSFAVFKNGNAVFFENVMLGGIHITNDIALGLSTNISSAERIKTLHGTTLGSSTDEHDMIDLPHINNNNSEDDTQHIQKSALVSIIRPRVEEILEIVKDKLDKAGYGTIGGHIIVTGGTSQLAGIKEITEKIFQMPVRIGTPKALDGLADSTKGAGFSTCVGILRFALKKRASDGFEISSKGTYTNNPFIRIGRWFKEHF